MSDTKPSPGQSEALARQLKETLSRRRFQPWKVVFGALVLASVVLFLMTYWMYPRSRPAPMQVMALDSVTVVDEPPVVRAQLYAPDAGSASRLKGQTIIVQDQRLLGAGGKPREVNVVTDARGQASTDWPIDNAPRAEYLVRYVDADQKSTTSDRARIFVFSKEARILIVDFDTIQSDAVDPKASESLARAAGDGWRVIYLSMATAKPQDFRDSVAWLARNQAKLPIGPVLGRLHYSETEDSEKARREALKGFEGRFKGPIIAVVKSVEAAATCKDAGIRAIILGSAATPSWADASLK